MRVKDLIALLSVLEPDKEIVLDDHEIWNDYSVLDVGKIVETDDHFIIKAYYGE